MPRTFFCEFEAILLNNMVWIIRDDPRSVIASVGSHSSLLSRRYWLSPVVLLGKFHNDLRFMLLPPSIPSQQVEHSNSWSTKQNTLMEWVLMHKLTTRKATGGKYIFRPLDFYHFLLLIRPPNPLFPLSTFSLRNSAWELKRSESWINSISPVVPLSLCLPPRYSS